MYNVNKLLRPLSLALLLSSLGACGSEGYYDGYNYYPYDYPWYYSPYGTWTVIRRPVVVVDGWAQRSFRHRQYRGYAVRRHNSPSITYLATQGNRTIEVVLTPRNDSTQIEIRARQGEKAWDREQAKVLLGRILAEYKAPAKK